MAWFDGTTDFEKNEFEKQFPVYITENLRTNAERNKLAIINDFHTCRQNKHRHHKREKAP